MEIWWRGEVRNEKIWTKEHQPFLPYIIFEGTEEIVRVFYDPRGIEWIKNLLKNKVKKDKNFPAYLEKNFLENLANVRAVYEKTLALDHTDLCRYLDIYERGYVWFEAAWWLWDLSEKEQDGIALPKRFIELREKSQDYVPKSEDLFRVSLRKIYSEIKDFVGVLGISEIKENKIPALPELSRRKKGYYFTDNKLFAGLSGGEIEEMYKIKFERAKVGDSKEIRGDSAFGGKVSGKAKVVLNFKNISKVESGDIMVSSMTLPGFLPAIRKSAAIVTDEGGILSHAAIIARELKKPCIIGTKIATKVLRDGDLVEVDANAGVVRVLRRNKT